MFNIFTALLGFSALILLHELGHYVMAKIHGVTVTEFSIGMGKTIWKTEKNGTLWSLKLFPIGGMCSMKGETKDRDSKDDDAFKNKSPLKRISIVAAGPIVNILVAVFLFSGYAFIEGYTPSSIESVLPGKPAEKAGLKSGDEIVEIDGYKVMTGLDVSQRISDHPEKEKDVVIRREGILRRLKVTPYRDEETGRYLFGYKPVNLENLTPYESLIVGIYETQSFTQNSLYFFSDLIHGKSRADDLTGPVGTLEMTSQSVNFGLNIFLKILGMVSVSLAVFNLIPFPALDGGWILLILIEMIRQKKIPDKFIMKWNAAGMICLLSLMLIVTVKDLIKFIIR